MSTLLPFPIIARRAFIRRQAARLAALSPSSVESCLTSQVERQRVTLTRKGIPQVLAERECSAFRRAVEEDLARLLASSRSAR